MENSPYKHSRICYSLKFGSEKTDYKCTGSSKDYVDYKERHEDIKRSVLSYLEKRVEMKSVMLLDKDRIAISMEKIDFTGLDTNRMWFTPGTSLPFGYKGKLPVDVCDGGGSQ